MRRVLPCLGAAMAALTMTWTIETQAQELFKDVPPTHWAYQAVTDLQKQKILVGYVDGRFNGQRTLTRYEFAVALKRVLESIPAVPGSGPAGKTGAQGAAGKQGETGPQGEMGPSGLTAGQIADLSKLTDMFQKELNGIGVDAKQALTRLGVLEKSVDSINQRLDRMIQFNGDFFTGVRTDSSRFGFDDYSGAMRFPNNSFFKQADTPHDFHLLATAKLPDGVKFIGDIVASNYLSYRSSLTVPGILLGGPSTANRNGFPEQVSLYQAEVQIPIGNFGANTTLEIGRFKNQVTPLTYYRPDGDVYFDLPWYDDGNFIQDGVKLDTKFGSAHTQLWAGSYTSLATSQAGDYFNRPFVGLETGPRTFSPTKPTDYPIPFTQGAGIANQSAGLHVGVPLFKYGELGLTLIDFTTGSTPAGGFPFANSFGNVTVYGANLKLNPIGSFLINAEAAKSVTQTDLTHGDGQSNEDNNAFNLNVGYNRGPFNVDVGYQYIDPRFGAPGYWNKIGNWYNPTNVQGPFVRIAYDIAPKITFHVGGDYLMGARNRSLSFAQGVGGGLSTHDNIGRVTAGVQFAACSHLTLSADYEGVFWDLATASSAIGREAHPIQHYITLGAGVKLQANTQLKIGYQIGAYQNGAGFGGYGASGNSSNFNVFTAQVNSHF